MLDSNKPGKYTYYEISSKGKEFIIRVLSLETIFSLAVALLILGNNRTLMIFDQASFTSNELANCIYSLSMVYLVWILIVAFLYPFCKKYVTSKLNNPEKWWLSYL